MNDRQLVTIRTIEDVKPIEKADAIALAYVDGWQVVTKKNEFKVGDLALYFEIDSFIKLKDPRFDFLSKRARKWNGDIGILVKTIKLRGQLSQGLLIPLDEFQDVLKLHEDGIVDFSDYLDVVKYERPEESEHVQNESNSTFPLFIPKTGENRVQNIKNKLPNRFGETFEVSLKLDGQSMTVFKNDGHYGVCSKNHELDEDEIFDFNPYLHVSKRDDLKGALESLHGNYAFSGELVGPNIIRNRENFDDYEFFIFNIYDIDNKKYLSPKLRRDVCNHLISLGFNIKHIHVYHEALKLEHTLDELLTMAEGKSLNGSIREGIIFKSNESDFSFKVISNDYLLKE